MRPPATVLSDNVCHDGRLQPKRRQRHDLAQVQMLYRSKHRLAINSAVRARQGKGDSQQTRWNTRIGKPVLVWNRLRLQRERKLKLTSLYQIARQLPSHFSLFFKCLKFLPVELTTFSRPWLTHTVCETKGVHPMIQWLLLRFIRLGLRLGLGYTQLCSVEYIKPYTGYLPRALPYK